MNQDMKDKLQEVKDRLDCMKFPAWIIFFDKIYLINLPERIDRKVEVYRELNSKNIPVTLVKATKHEKGAYGLFLTVQNILKEARYKNYNNILILEDDVVFEDNANEILDKVVRELPVDYDLLYLGANVNAPLQKLASCEHLLQCSFMIATQAVAYSKKGISTTLKELEVTGPLDSRFDPRSKTFSPIDMQLVRVQMKGKSYVVNPIIATQNPGYSDVEKRHVDYKNFIQERFSERLNQMNR